MSGLFCGIDPGQTGGVGIIDHEGGYIVAWRWNSKNPIDIYNNLYKYREWIKRVYIEKVRIFPREQKGFITQNQGLLINSGIHQGFLLALGLPYLQIDPSAWQAAQSLHHWAKRKEKNQNQHSPLSLARSRWPTAPLDYQADDGKAVALLLADLACRDHHAHLDRGAIQEAAASKRKTKQQALRQARKAAKAFLGA